MTNPWDRQPEETDKAWMAFVAWRDMGPTRTVPSMVASIGKPAGYSRQVERWMSAYDWRARSAAWDGHVDRRSVQPAVAEARAEMAARHAALGKAMQGVAARGLSALSKHAERMRGTEVSALAKAGFDIERVATGQPNVGLGVSAPDGGELQVRIMDLVKLPDPRKDVAE